MTGEEMIWGMILFISLAGGAGSIGYAMSRAARQEKPRILTLGFVVMIAGAVLGYIVVESILFLGPAGH